MFEFEDFHINMFSSERIRAIVINLSGTQLCGMVYICIVHTVKNALVSKTPQHVTKLYHYGVNFVSIPHTYMCKSKMRTKSNFNIRTCILFTLINTAPPNLLHFAFHDNSSMYGIV